MLSPAMVAINNICLLFYDRTAHKPTPYSSATTAENIVLEEMTVQPCITAALLSNLLNGLCIELLSNVLAIRILNLIIFI